jgi:LAO/AO transport system kinase
VDVVKSADTTVIAVVPGVGDEIQDIKAGILEVGDIFVINKADREGADKTLSDLRLMIDMDHKKYDEGGWKPPIVMTEAVFDTGVDNLLEEIEKHRAYVESHGDLQKRKREARVREELADMIKARLIETVVNSLTESTEFDGAVESIVTGEIDPYTACDRLVLPVLRASSDT